GGADVQGRQEGRLPEPRAGSGPRCAHGRTAELTGRAPVRCVSVRFRHRRARFLSDALRNLCNGRDEFRGCDAGLRLAPLLQHDAARSRIRPPAVRLRSGPCAPGGDGQDQRCRFGVSGEFQPARQAHSVSRVERPGHFAVGYRGVVRAGGGAEPDADTRMGTLVHRAWHDALRGRALHGSVRHAVCHRWLGRAQAGAGPDHRARQIFPRRHPSPVSVPTGGALCGGRSEGREELRLQGMSVRTCHTPAGNIHMRMIAILLSLLSSVCWAQGADTFQPVTTNVWGAEYPRVDGQGRVQIRISAPAAQQVKLNFWSGPKLDMQKQADGFWSITTEPLVPGFHYYTVIVDGAEVSDPGSQA